VKECKPHIVTITETHPKNCRFEVTDAEIQIEGYNIFRSSQAKEARGSIIYVNENLPTTVIPTKTTNKECLAVEIQVDNKQALLLALLYRSPSNTDEANNSTIDWVNEITKLKHDNFLLLGDFNIPAINWQNYSCSINNPEDINRRFLSSIKDNYLIQNVMEPTRSRLNNQANILDLILTKEENFIETIEYESPLGKSDHCVLKVAMNCMIDNKIKEDFYRDFNRGDFDGMARDLNIDWTAELRNKSVEDQWYIIKQKTNIAISAHIPLRKVQNNKKNNATKNKPKKDILIEIKKKHRLWQRYMETKEKGKHKDYCRQRNKVRKMTRDEEKYVEKQVAEHAKTNPKKFWNFVRRKTRIKEKIPKLELRSQQGQHREYAEADRDKAKILQDFFVSVFTKEQTAPPELENYTNVKMSDIEITREKVTKKLKALKTAKSPGPDKLHPKIFRNLAEILDLPLYILYKNSLSSGKVPKDWKSAEITAIHKKGNKHVPGNYRPVSLTCIACKIMEAVIRDEVTLFFESNNLWSEKQYGFLKGRSTVSQLINMIDDWINEIDQGRGIDNIYLDFQKAFDTVPHNRLLTKLKAYGIENNTLKWISDFLSNRRQRVRVNEDTSEWNEVTSGIPQGSVLGPTLFIIFVNDLPPTTSTKCFMFADDTKVYNAIPKTQDTEQQEQKTLQKGIDALVKWSETWLMTFNETKCKVLKVWQNENDFRYHMRQTELEEINEEKDLGVYIDKNLDFKFHIYEKTKKANKIMGIIRRSFKHLNGATFTKLFKGIVRPHVEYGNSIWSPHLKYLIDEVEDVQRRATKQLPGMKDLEYDQRLKSLKLPCLLYRRIRGDMIETFKLLTGKYDNNVPHPLKLIAHQHNTRGHKLKLEKSQSKLDIKKYSFGNRVIKLWNSLPSEVVNPCTMDTFKSRLDKHFSRFNIEHSYENCYNFYKLWYNKT
jgi:hypothetical protein